MSIRTCVDRILPMEFEGKAAQAALQERPDNAPPADEGGFEAAVETKKLWRNGRTLRVAFLEGDDTVKANVKRHAETWTEYVNLKFEFVSGTDAEIRIAFQDVGSWSAVGTDALVEGFFAPGEATMNYGWLSPTSTDEDYSVVLHEFGHAIGMIHEHQSPGGKIQWNKPVVYRDLGGPPNNWPPAQVDHNVFNRYRAKKTQFTKFDPDSIMLYFFPKEWTLDGQSFKENKVLSKTDIEFMKKMYPKRESNR